MKILHITPSYIPAYSHGGPVVSVHILNKWLVKLGVDVTVYTTNVDGDKKLDVPLNQEVNTDEVKIFYFPLSFRAWKYSLQLHSALKNNMKDFDLIHITSVFLSASMLGAYYAKKYRKPYIISPRGNFMKQTYGSKSLKKIIYTHCIEKYALKNAFALHFTSEAEKNDYIHTKLPFRKALIIPNPLNEEMTDREKNNMSFRDTWKIHKNAEVILSLGRLHWVKGFDTLIPAFADVLKEKPGAVLVIAGPDESNYKKEIELLITCHKVQGHVIFTGIISGEEKASVLREADVFVVPSFSESFGMSAVEAMQAGIATILTDGVGIAEDAQKANAAVVIKKDKDEFANAIIRLLENETKRKELGKRGAEFVEREYSEASVAKKMTDAYRQIVENSPRI